MPKLIRADSTSTDFQALVKLLDAELAIRDGDEHAFYAQFNKTDLLRNVILCYEEDRAVGCGAFRPFEKEGQVEIKRMYVLPECRGRGIASHLLKALESWAAELGNHSCFLETGKNQPEAIGLYQKAGYSRIENYGQYLHIESSVCIQKVI
ncbi:MAG: GNAT family N-acetyltransferase [Chitinophagaceae bacterium]|nr:GNAT family N-acetyltransferase [Chitinophagaceae bacterium]